MTTIRQFMARRPVDRDPHAAIQGASLGERIEAAMRRAGLNKTTLARELDVRWATVHDWCTKEVAPSADNIRSIAEVTGVTVDELLGVAEGQDPPFAAWPRFLEVLERDGDSMTVAERRALQSFVWPPGVSPTVAAYQTILHGLRAAVHASKK